MDYDNLPRLVTWVDILHNSPFVTQEEIDAVANWQDVSALYRQHSAALQSQIIN